MKLQDRVALITGGGRGLGKAIALRFVGDGAAVVLAGRDRQALDATRAEVEASGGRALVVEADVTREDQIAAMANAARREFGRVDILVNNAGILGPTAPLVDVTRDEWDEVLAVNITGAMLASRAVLPEMIARRSGKIINISSVAGKLAYALRAPYAASKWGLIGLTLTMAKELGPHNLQVNAICPGPVEGERMETVIEHRAAQLGQTVDEMRRTYLGMIPLGRMVRADDVAALALLLASAEGDNITGQAIDVSAGFGL